MGGRRSPKLQRQFVHLPCLQETDFLRNVECGGASGQRTQWRAKLYPCTACWPIGIVKFTARTLKRMIFRVVRSTYLRVGARILGLFTLSSSARKTLHSREAHLLPEVNPIRRSLPLSKLSSIQLCVT
ncbi:hypothetical protein TNCV_3150811 [Trichonephila clavipes]|nr:hypothetical protein TNCV_3150811 [Trichonephila clavipes]